MTSQASKSWEYFHLARAACWPLAAPVILFTPLKTSVPVVIMLSLYANFAGDISAWQAARAERRSKENPSKEAPSCE